jgi:L-fuculose-phosphate aldolase
VATLRRDEVFRGTLLPARRTRQWTEWITWTARTARPAWTRAAQAGCSTPVDEAVDDAVDDSMDGGTMDDSVPGTERGIWAEVVDAACRTVADGLVVGTSGNVSARAGDLVLVTPTGVPYDRLGPRDAVGVDPATGERVRGDLRPTSELPLHLALYRETGARAIVHTHAPYATAVSTLVGELPAIHYMAADLGGRVLVADYALYGTDDLARAVLRALPAGHTGCLMRNHGMITFGDTLDQAYDRSAQLEWMCRVWLLARSATGTGAPHTLSPAEMDQAAARIKGYGQGRGAGQERDGTGGGGEGGPGVPGEPAEPAE